MRFQNQTVSVVSDDPASPTIVIKFSDGSEMSVPRAEVTPDEPAPAAPEAPVAEVLPETQEKPDPAA